MNTRSTNFVIAFFLLIFNVSLSFGLIQVINLGTVLYKNQVQGTDEIETEKLNYKITKDKIISVLRSNKIKFNYQTCQIKTNWYEYDNKACKLYITIMADESKLRMQFQQKDLDKQNLKKMNPYKIKKEIEKILSK